MQWVAYLDNVTPQGGRNRLAENPYLQMVRRALSARSSGLAGVVVGI